MNKNRPKTVTTFKFTTKKCVKTEQDWSSYSSVFTNGLFTEEGPPCLTKENRPTYLSPSRRRWLTSRTFWIPFPRRLSRLLLLLFPQIHKENSNLCIILSATVVFLSQVVSSPFCLFEQCRRRGVPERPTSAAQPTGELSQTGCETQGCVNSFRLFFLYTVDLFDPKDLEVRAG